MDNASLLIITLELLIITFDLIIIYYFYYIRNMKNKKEEYTFYMEKKWKKYTVKIGKI